VASLAIDRRAAGTKAALTSNGIFPPPIPYVLSRHSPTISLGFKRIRLSIVWFPDAANGAELVTTLLALIWASSPYVRFEFSGKIVDSVLGMISDLNTNGGIIITRESPLCVLSPQCCVGSNAPSRQGGSSPYRSVELA